MAVSSSAYRLVLDTNGHRSRIHQSQVNGAVFTRFHNADLLCVIQERIVSPA